MDGNSSQGSGRGRLAAAIVVALVAAVAVASTGSVGSGSATDRRPSEALLDTIVSLVVVGMALGAVVAAVLLVHFRREVAAADGPTRRSSRGVMIALLWLGGLVLVLALLLRSDGSGNGRNGLLGGLDGAGRGDATDANRYEPEFQPWPVLVVVLLAAVACLAWWRSSRARRRAFGAGGDPGPALVLAEVLDETLDDLRSEPDPRRAVIGAYARMERGLAAAGVPRDEAEAPGEYLERMLVELALSARSAGRRTALFSWARFSRHDVEEDMKQEAIETLEQVRDELRALDAARLTAEAERLRVLRGAA